MENPETEIRILDIRIGAHHLAQSIVTSFGRQGGGHHVLGARVADRAESICHTEKELRHVVARIFLESTLSCLYATIAHAHITNELLLAAVKDVAPEMDVRAIEVSARVGGIGRNRTVEAACGRIELDIVQLFDTRHDVLVERRPDSGYAGAQRESECKSYGSCTPCGSEFEVYRHD